METIKREKPKSHVSIAFSVMHLIIPIFIIIITLTISSTIFVIDNKIDVRPFGRIGNIYIYSPFILLKSILLDVFDVNKIIEQNINDYNNASKILITGSMISMLVFLIMSYARTLLIRNKDLLGTARWGTIKDLKEKGLLNCESVIFGQTENAKIKTFVNEKGVQYKIKKTGQIIGHNQLAHALMCAPTRSGKGISCVIPTALSHKGSLIVFDPKGELWAITAGYRSTFSNVYRFSPLSEKSIRMNYLDAIRIDEKYAFRDASLIADILLSPQDGSQAGENEKHFIDTAKDLLTTTMLHIRTSKKFKQKNMEGVLKYLSGAMCKNKSDSDEVSDEMSTEILQGMINDEHVNKIIHEQIVEGANRALVKPDRERGSVFSTALRVLWLFQDKITAENTSVSDLKFEDFYSDKPISLYLTIPNSDIDRVSPLIRLIVQFLVRRLVEKDIDDEYILKNKILFLLDEFPLLGKFEFIEKQLGILAGYNIVFLLIIQSTNQLKKIYGDKHSFFDHCKFWIFYQTEELEVAKYVSEVIGKETIYKENASISGKKTEAGLGGLSIQGQEIERNLVNPDMLMRLPDQNMLVFGHGMRPYLAKKIAYYSDKRFKDKVNWKKPETREEMLKQNKENIYIKERIMEYVNNVTLEEAIV